MVEQEQPVALDFLIIGQGLAGTLLAYALMKKNKRVAIIDNDFKGSATKIAAGVINPITGRRIVKSWRIDDFLPFARTFYKDLEQEIDIPLWHERDLVRTLADNEAENEWLLRSSWAEYHAFCGSTSDHNTVSTDFDNTLNSFFSYATTTQVAQVNVSDLIVFFQKKWLAQGILIQEKIDTDDFEIQEGHVFYKKYLAKRVIFCEGAKGADNPFFGWLPFNLDKGESLVVKISEAEFQKIFKHNISIVPLKEKNTYWVGATNEWNSPHDLPTQAKREILVAELREILKTDFEILAHHAAFRPTVKDRRPMLGFHPNFRTLGIFNGFGTKGASLVPFWANHFVDYLLFSSELEKEVSIERFL